MDSSGEPAHVALGRQSDIQNGDPSLVRTQRLAVILEVGEEHDELLRAIRLHHTPA